MVLFPIALIWLVCVVIWLVRNSTNEPELPPDEPRRWWPRPRRPGRGPTGSRSRDRAASR